MKKRVYKNISNVEKRVINVFRLFIFLFILFSALNPISVMADRDEVDAIVEVGTGRPEISGICARANKSNGVTSDILVYTSSDGLLTFSNKLYSELELEDKKDFMEVALLTTKESGLGTTTKNKVYNFIAQQDSSISASIRALKSDTSADFVSAWGWFKPFGKVGSMIMGFICLLIFMSMALSIIIDIAYIVIPPFQMLLDRKGKNEKPRFASMEAKYSVMEVENSGVYSNILWIYTKRRWVQIIIAAIALGLLINGGFYSIIAFFVDAFQLG